MKRDCMRWEDDYEREHNDEMRSMKRDILKEIPRDDRQINQQRNRTNYLFLVAFMLIPKRTPDLVYQTVQSPVKQREHQKTRTYYWGPPEPQINERERYGVENHC